MRKGLGLVLFVALILLTGAFASEDAPQNAEGDNPGSFLESDECQIFNAIFIKYISASLNRRTISYEAFDDTTAEYLRESGIQPDSHMISDFKRKNSKPYEMNEKCSDKRAQTDEVLQSIHGRQSVTMSRPGFNTDKNQALLFVWYKTIGPQKAYIKQEGFLFLKKNNNKWIVTKKIMIPPEFY